jgi:hypothetical protein
MNTQRLHTPDWIESSTNSMLFGFTDMLKELKSLKGERTTMIELGCYMGESTMLFAASNIFDKIYTIEPHEGHEIFSENYGYSWELVKEQFEINTRYFDNISLISDYSHNVVDRFKDNSIDFIYIDANHSYESVKQDLILYYPKVKQGGYIGGHDYHEIIWPEVVTAIHEVIGYPDKTFDDTSWIYQKSKKLL